MKQTTYALLFILFYYSQLLGVVNFYYDCRKGKASKNLYITIYSFIMSLAMFGVIPYFALTMEIKTRPPGAADLHYKLNLTIALIRIGGVLITLVLNWTKRNYFIKLLNKFHNFSKYFVRKWQVAKKFENYLDNGIREKCSRAIIADFIMFIGSIQVFRDIFDVKNPFILLALAVIPTVLNVIMAHYYFAILNANILLILINDEVKRILNSSASLYKQQRSKRINRRALTNHCYHLADELNELSADLYKLQKLIKCINKIYDVQGVCCALALYITNISVLYALSMLSEHKKIWAEYPTWAIYLIPVGLFIHYIDLYLFYRVMINCGELVEKTGQLLKQKQFWLPTLDERLEKSLNNFSLQLASFPAYIDLMGLYNANRPMALAVIGSTISNAIVLVQYDFKYTKEN